MTATPSSWKNISVFLDESPAGQALCLCAASLAHRFGARLVGVHCLRSAEGERPADGFVRGREAMDKVIARLREEQESRLISMGHHFGALARRFDLATEFRVIRDGNGDEEALPNSLHSDLLVLGSPTPHGLPEKWTAEKLFMASGVPTLLIPDNWSGVDIGHRVLVAWNGSRQARRAIADAMPILVNAAEVTVLIVDSLRTPERFGEAPGVDISTHPARHGVPVELDRVESHGAPVASVLAAEASRRSADMVVIGAYSRARSAELLFGGVTRDLLAHTPLPILTAR